MQNKEYWYFRLKNDFFNLKAIRELETVPFIGDKLIVILLKLYTMSIGDKGFLKVPIYHPNDNYITTLAKWCYEEPKNMEIAMSYFQKLNLITIYHNMNEVECELPYIKDNIGKSSTEADRIKRLRNEKKELELKENQLSFPIVQEINKKNNQSDSLKYGIFKNVFLTDEEYRQLDDIYKNANEIINNLSLYYEKTGNKYKSDYAGCLSFAKKDGIKKPKASIEEMQSDIESRKEEARSEIYSKYPKLEEINLRLSELYSEKIKISLSGSKNINRIELIEQEIIKLENRQNEYIKIYNIPKTLF